MRKYILFGVAVLVCLYAYADTYIDGYLHESTEVMSFNGIPEPSAAPSGDGRIYVDSTDLTLKLIAYI